MKKLLYSLLSVLIIVASCSKQEEVVAPPAPKQFTLAISAETGGTVSTEGGLYNEGSKITVTATPDGMYLFKEWSDGSTQNPREITVTSNLTLKASFIKKTYPLAVTVEGEGTVAEEVIVQGSTTETEYNAGTTVRLTATPNEGWVFAGWSGDVESEELVIEVPIEKGTSVSALFKRDSFELNITIEGEGTVKEEVIVQPGQYDYETVVRLTAIPAEGYEFAGWSGDLTSEENPIELGIMNEVNLSVRFEKSISLFPYRSPNYTGVNLRSGTVINNIYAPEYHLTTEYIASEIEIFENCTCQACGCETKYLMGSATGRFFDFNNDDKPDYFAFLANWDRSEENTGNYAKPGKYVIIEDVFGDPKKYYFDSERQFDGRTILGDFDGDGFTEILVYSSEDHDNGIGEPVADKIPLSILKYNGSGNLKVTPIGPPTSNHDLTVLDFDNDGDLDIINFEWYLDYDDPFNKSNPESPVLYTNNGNGSFSISKDRIILSEYYTNETSDHDFIILSSDSFDLNNDGYLDLVTAGGISSNPSEYPLTDLRIVWGSEDFIYDYNKSLKVETSLFGLPGKGILGFNFVDYNQDGFFDIVSFGDHDLTTGFIDIYRNNNGESFTQVTSEIISSYKWPYIWDNGSIPVFYDLEIIDVDNDGDQDLRPKIIEGSGILDYAIHSNKKGIGPNYYWENIGGTFILNEDFYDIDPKWFEIVYKKDF